MRVLGVIVEYNPLHHGHLYHLNKAKELVQPDYTLAVMSGNFTQRGEPAVVDKFARTEMALRSGIDVVVELPTVFAIQDAGGFAFGAVSILHNTHVVTDVVFGSESGKIDILKKIAEIIVEEPEDYVEYLHQELKKGLSFPNARRVAIMRYVEKKRILDPTLVDIIARSNDILGLEYLVSAYKLKTSMEFHTIRRIGADYTEQHHRGKYSSATAIRNSIKSQDMEKVKEAVPSQTFEILMREFREGRGPIFYEDLSVLILATFRTLKRSDLSVYTGFNEGLDERFAKYAPRSRDALDLLEKVKAKRFTFSRLRRLSLYPILMMRKDLVNSSNKKGPQYLRILGFTKKGRELLAIIREKALLPHVTNASQYIQVLKKSLKKERFMHIDPSLFIEQFELDVRATNIHSVFFRSEEHRSYERDMRLGPVIIQK